ncbi:SAM-dependent methyltransferase [Methanococcus maripaludis]|uniref:SAM-dependent methyltransferase n=1 Tax=Methanococcus maripaludis TaxID=39152 RepID=A0A7J9NH02_METMI|nr:methyltransferase domain-containing protein [Methanococcus maripaludis]MBA2840128.1 SAM-dependent methyltransferase [Methanococcus maripaludis]
MPMNKFKIKKIFSPYFLDEYSIFKKIKKYKKYFNGVVLDIGCRDKPYVMIIPHEKYIGLDLDPLSKADIIADATNIPLNSESIDTIFSTQTIGDIYNIDKFYSEAFRLLKNNGYLIMTSEFICGLHDEPFDYYRFTKYGIKRQLEDSGFEIIHLEETSNSITSAGYILAVSLWKTYLSFENILFKRIVYSAILLLIFINNIFFLVLGKSLCTYESPLGYGIVAKKRGV